MKPLLLLFLLACTGDYEEPPHLVLDDPTPNLPAPTFPAYTFDDGGPNNRYVLFYNCDPIPDFITFVVFDCAGNFVSRLMISPAIPCRGYDVVEVPVTSHAASDSRRSPSGASPNTPSFRSPLAPTIRFGSPSPSRSPAPPTPDPV